MNFKKKAASVLAGVGAAAAAGTASAGDLATAFSSGVDKTELGLIGAAVMTVVGVIFLIKSSRRAAGG